MILVGIGSNLATAEHGSPRDTVRAALAAMPALGIAVAACSPWFESEPVPPSDQPWFVNGVAVVATALAAAPLLDRLLLLERAFGRRRGRRNAARTLDLDLLDYEGRVIETANLTLPHPRLHQRRFVLAPLCDIAPGWHQPGLGLTAAALLAGLPAGQPVRRIGEAQPDRVGGDCG